MNNELKPCPFCGGEAKLTGTVNHENWKVICLNEKCICSFSKTFDFAWQALEAWNAIPVRTTGDVYTIEEFIEFVKNGCIIDYDGFGYFGNETESNVMVNCDMNFLNKHKDKYKYVFWYNK